MNDFTSAAELMKRGGTALSPFEAAAERMKQQRASSVGMSLTYDDRDPDAAAKSLAVGKELGVSPLIVDAEPEAYDARLQMQRAAKALKDAPKTAAWLSDMGNGVLAKDDIDNLTWFERNTGPIGRAAGRGVRRVPVIADTGTADINARILADIGRPFDEIYQEEVARFGPNPPYVVQADARRAAQFRFDLVQGLGPEDTLRIVQKGADALSSARERMEKIAAIPMSDTARSFVDNWLSPAENTVSGVLGAFASDPAGGAAFVVETAAEFLPVLAASSVATAATRSPAAGVAVMGGSSYLIESSNSAMEFLAEKGVDLSTPEAAASVLQNAELMQEARDRGLTRGLIIGIMDTISGGVAGKAITKSPVGEVLAQGLAQVFFGSAGEGLAQVAAGQEVSWADIIVEGLAELATAPIEVLGVGGRRLLKGSAELAKSGKTSEHLDEADARAMASKLRERAPEKFKEALDAQGLGEQAVYVPADALKEYFQAKDLSLDEETMRAWGIDPLTFDEAAQSGNDVAIPMSNYATYIAGTEDAAWFKDNATSDPEEMSAAMAKAFNDSVQDIMMDAFEEAERARLADDELRAADVQIYDQVFSQLRAAGRSPDVAKNEASIWAAFWRTMGERYGEDPLDLAKSMGVDIRGPQTEDVRRRDQLDIALNTLRTKGALKPKGLSLTEFVARKGGVQDEGGDVAAIEPPKGVVAETNEEIRARKSQPAPDGMPATGRGVNLEDMARMAVEAGYFPDLLAAVNEGQMDGAVERLVAALRDDVGGRKVYAEGEGPDAALQALSEALSERGLDPATMTNDEIAAAMEATDGQSLLQSATIRRGAETLAKFGLEAGKSYTTREVAAALEARQRKKWGTIEKGDYSPEASKKIAGWMVEEVLFEVEKAQDNPSRSAVGWYSTKFQRALDNMGKAFPEFLGSMDESLPGVKMLGSAQAARDLFTAFMAITSDGAKVADNFRFAKRAYSDFRKTGIVNTEVAFGGDRNTSMRLNLAAIQSLLEEFGPEGMPQALLAKDTISNLKKRAKAEGRELTVKYKASMEMPYSAVIFGPKLGAFYANLMGDTGYLTMDRWWSRTFNRYRGTLLTSATPEGLARVKSLLGNAEMTDDEAYSAMAPHVANYKAKGFKQGTELEKAANTVWKAAFEQIEDTPFNASDREFMIDTAVRAQRSLKRRGVDLTVADLQAVLWYYEKRLYGELGARQTQDISYEEIATTVAAEIDADGAGTGGLADEGGAFALDTEGDETSPEPVQDGDSEPFQGAAGDGSGRDQGGSLAPLPGAPTVEGASGPDAGLLSVAEEYARAIGLDLRRQSEFVEVNPERAARIAQAYEEMKHDPADPAVRAAYADLIEQTMAQYRALEAAGYQFYLFDEQTDPYEGNPWNAMRDLRANKRMAVFATEAGYGSGNSTLDTTDNPLLADTGLQWAYGTPDGPQKRVLANDLFRAVHDAFGHGLEGAGFRARGEENAWQAHVRLFHGPAVAAITSETRGQNSWLNYGPHGEKNRTASVEETVFADQKTGLMPEWTWTEGRAGDAQVPSRQLFQSAPLKTDTPEFKAWFGDSKVVDGNGKPLVVYHSTNKTFDRFDPEKVIGSQFWFTDDRAAIDAGEVGAAGRGIVMEVYLSLQNPAGWAEYDKFGIDELIGRGFDGLKLTEKDGTATYVAFNPTQIKSVNNRGTFDPNDPRILYQPAYHGSPHIFDRFSLDKIGTGEGAQAFGWGLYFAGRKGVAEYYRKSLTPLPGVEAGPYSSRLQYKGELFSRVLSDHPEWATTDDSRSEVGRQVDNLSRALWAHVEKQGANPTVTVDNWLTEQERFEQGLTKPPYDSRGDGLAVIRAMRDMPTPEWVEPKGRLYKVDIPEDSDLLAWDAPLSEQPEKVKAAVRDVMTKFWPEEDAEDVALGMEETGQAFYERISVKVANDAYAEGQALTLEMAKTGAGWTPENIARNAEIESRYRNADRAASIALRDAGIPGHRFLDGGSRGGAAGLVTPGGSILTGGALMEAMDDRALFDGVSGWEEPVDDVVAFSMGNTLTTSEGKRLWANMQKAGWTKPARGSGTYNYVIYDDAAVSVLEFEQPKRGSIVLPSGGLGQGQTVINLFEAADLSTFIHESGHFFLEAFQTLASDETAPQGMKDDMAAILDWFGVKDWSEVGVKQHEQWARGFEAYTMEGKAPSLALADAFARFKAWLTRIYRSIAGLDVKITPEIREVMDRMLATDAEIAEARAEMEMRPLFSAAPPGMSESDFATYRRMARRATESAEQSLLEKTMAKVRREKEAWYREEKRATLAEVAVEFDRRREYRLIDMLANQIWNGLDETGNAIDVPDMQIDRAMLVEQFGEGVIPELSRTKFGGKRAIYGDNGSSPEEVAEFFGFESASEMIAVLQNTAKKRDAVAAETERRMTERHGDPLNDGSIEEEAVAAIHNEQQANTSVAEARHMAKQLGKSTAGMTAKLYRQRARAMVGRMSVRDVIKPERFLASERRAARAAQDAFAKVARGTKAETALAAALQAKEQQILNGFIYDEARKVSQEVQKGREKMRAYTKQSVREKLEGGYIEQIDAILQDYDFRVRGQGQIARAESLKAFVDRMIEEGREGELSIDARLMDEAHRRHYTRLSVDELRGLFDTIDNIDHMGRFKQKLIDRNRKRELRASVDRVVEQVRANLGTGKAGEKSKIASAFNLLWRTDTLLQRLDAGEEIGPAYDEIKRSIDEATSVEQEMHVEMAERLDALFNERYSAADLKKMRIERDIPGGNGRAWSKMEILSVALNTGNEDNYIRLTAKDAAPRNRLTRDQVNALLSTLDENDWRFVQDMWGMIDTYWSGLSEVARRRTGVTPKKVEAKLMVDAPPFVTGGYYPIKYDPNLSAAAAADEASGWDKFTATGRGATAAIRNGMTIQRQKSGNGRTLRLDLSVAFAHMRDTIRYTALSEAVDNTYRLLAQSDVQNAFLDAGAKDQLEILRLWLKDVASGPAPSPDAVNTTARIIKNNFTLSRLALNFKTVALQVTGVGQSAVVIGKRNLVHGYMEYLRNPTGTAAEVIEKSSFMRERQSTFQKDIYDFMDDTQIAGPVSSTYKKGKATLAKIGFAPIVWTQFWTVDMPTWLGAFRAGIEKYGDEAKAAHFADRMVARAQDSGLMADRAAFERGTLSESQRQSDWVRLFTTLGGYMLTKLNRAYVTTIQSRTAWRSTNSGAQRVAIAIGAATNLSLLYLTEAIMLALIYSLMADDEDDEDLKKFLLRETGSAIVGGIPFIRDAYSAFAGYGGGGIYGSVAEAPANFIKQAAQGENDAALRRSIADIIGTVTGLPTTGPMRAIEGALDDDIPLSEAIFGRNPLNR